ncbi:hypothetical protein BIV57_21250 [Mangrovactinospora gilvigrisea]|uniref:DUF466 domain-containing protein n=1 Tax=Mangrovactinospora gilvigrisea TaxID=1428644 RepID=A0A1J7C796_9ACTN|nr:YbdD/YjiX family protein [Mangrovactinospora gilvigrisea]OIV35522.1 hypothetical protein BIV57_21250 [Mangrovactinospora gilvigrisea]
MSGVTAKIRWYVRELTGESAYDRYVERERAAGHQPLSRREFEIRRMKARESDPRQGFRCC